MALMTCDPCSTCNARHASFRPCADFDLGRLAGQREAREDGWTREILARYLVLVGEPSGEFDRGHVAGLRSIVEA